MPKHYKKDEKTATIGIELFEAWINECCKDHIDIIKDINGNGFLSVDGYDGPDLKKKYLDALDCGKKIPYTDLEGIQKYVKNYMSPYTWTMDYKTFVENKISV